MIVLHAFAISHFSEKARWALDWMGLPYRERLYLPGPHLLQTRRIARQSSVPILQHGRQVVQGSSEILTYLHELQQCHQGALIAPLAPAEDWEQELDHCFGLGLQRILYAALLGPQGDFIRRMWCLAGPPWARAFYAITYPAIAHRVAELYGCNDANSVHRATERFDACLARVDATLQRTPYLGGAKPSRADLTLAALLAPLCSPQEHPACWPALPDELRPFVRLRSSRPTFFHVTKMYREYRHVRASPYWLVRQGDHQPRRFSPPPEPQPTR